MRKFLWTTLALMLAVALVLPFGNFAWAQDGDGDDGDGEGSGLNLIDTAWQTGGFSEFLTAAQNRGLNETLMGDGPYTVFAPRDATWNAMSDDMQTRLDNDLMSLDSLVRYHIVQGEYRLDDLQDGDTLTTLEGSTIDVSVDEDGTVTLNDSVQITNPNILANNGVLHIIDGVLVPPVLREMDMTEGAQTGAEDLAYLRFAHLAPDAGSYRIYIDGQPSNIQELYFGNLSGWVELEANTYSIAVVPFDQDLDAAVIGPVQYVLNAGSWTTIAIIGSETADTLTAQVLREPYARLGEGSAQVTVFHAIADAPAIDVVTSDGTTLISGLSYAGLTTSLNSGMATAEVDAGTVTLQIVPSGQTEPVLLEQEVTLDAGTFYFVAAAGTSDDPQLVVMSVSTSELLENTSASFGEAGMTDADMEATEEPMDMAATEEPMDMTATEEATSP